VFLAEYSPLVFLFLVILRFLLSHRLQLESYQEQCARVQMRGLHARGELHPSVDRQLGLDERLQEDEVLRFHLRLQLGEHLGRQLVRNGILTVELQHVRHRADDVFPQVRSQNVLRHRRPLVFRHLLDHEFLRLTDAILDAQQLEEELHRAKLLHAQRSDGHSRLVLHLLSVVRFQNQQSRVDDV